MIDRCALYSEAHPSPQTFLQHSQNRHGKDIIVEQKRQCGEWMHVNLTITPIECELNSN